MKEMISKLIEVTYRVTTYSKGIFGFEYNPTSGHLELNVPKTEEIISKRYLINWFGGLQWQYSMVAKYPHIYHGDKVEVIGCKTIRFIDEKPRKSNKHGTPGITVHNDEVIFL